MVQVSIIPSEHSERAREKKIEKKKAEKGEREKDKNCPESMCSIFFSFFFCYSAKANQGHCDRQNHDYL